MEETDSRKIEKGKKYVFTNGAYSNYAIIDTYIALADFDLDEAALAFYQQQVGVLGETVKISQEGYDNKDIAILSNLDEEEFVQYLDDNKLIEKVNTTEIWLGGYGDYKILNEKIICTIKGDKK
jgi:hypothetical protein